MASTVNKPPEPPSASSTAPAHPSPLGPNSSGSASPTRASLDRPHSPVTASLLGQIDAGPSPNTALPNPSKPDARQQPSLREALGRVRAGRGGESSSALSPTTAASGAVSPTTGATGAITAALPPTTSAGVAAVGTGAGTLPSLGRTAGPQSLLDRQGLGQPKPQLPDAARTDAVWAAMQRTLADVELAADAASPQHFFGAGHPAALAELRQAQMKLAVAWARGEEEAVEGLSSRAGGSKESDKADAAKAATKEAERPSTSGTGKSPGASVSEDDVDATEADMAAARRRREASDRYFARVSQHVDDVTAKLEEVAVAMGKVEEEAREGWSDDEDGMEESGSGTDGSRL